MAKWGEGDPRWIVEDRPDATNVNNWHWTMKDASAWSKGKLNDFLTGLKIEDPSVGCWSVKEMKSMEGEASASNRKGNLIILYDWTIKLNIEGTSSDGKTDKGMLKITNFSDENTIDDIEIKVTLDGKDSILAHSIAKQSKPQIASLLTKYVTLLRDQYSQGVILPSHNTPKNKKVPESSKSNAGSKSQTPSSSSTDNGKVVHKAVRISTKRIKLTETFKCTSEDLFNVFVTQELVSAFTRSQAIVKGHKGGQFMYMNGEVTGEFLELDRPCKLVKKWRSKSWPDEHYSTVTIQLQQGDDSTTLTLTQTGIPDTDHERTKDGWRKFIFEPIKLTFGYGAKLY